MWNSWAQTSIAQVRVTSLEIVTSVLDGSSWKQANQMEIIELYSHTKYSSVALEKIFEFQIKCTHGDPNSTTKLIILWPIIRIVDSPLCVSIKWLLESPTDWSTRMFYTRKNLSHNSNFRFEIATKTTAICFVGSCYITVVLKSSATMQQKKWSKYGSSLLRT